MLEHRKSKLLLRLIVICMASLISINAKAFPVEPLQTIEEITITSPGAGTTLMGLISIYGTSDIPDFAKSDLAFSYAQGWPENWFSISNSDQPVRSGKLVDWDTSTITDGDYRLRFQVFLVDGSKKEIIINDLHVRNYTPGGKPVHSSGPAVMDPDASLNVVATGTPIVIPTSLPINPVELVPYQISASLLIGILILIALVAISGLYTRLRGR